jgi:hypothetical protein
VAYLGGIFFADYYCDDVETQGLVVYAVCFQEVPCGSYHPSLFARIYCVLSASVVFVASGLYLYENDGAISIAADDEVQLAGIATEIARDGCEALCL